MKKTKNTPKAHTTRRTQKPEPSLALTLVAMRMFELEGKGANKMIAAAASTVEKTLRGMVTTTTDPMNEIPYGYITAAAAGEHKDTQQDIAARIDKVAGADAFKLKDDVVTLQDCIAESAAFIGMLVGWTLRERMSAEMGGTR